MKNLLRKNWWLAGILILSIVFRIVAALYMGDKVVDLPGTFDQISYNTLALRVLHGYGFTFGETWWPITPAGAPTAHWSFLYTLYLAAVYSLLGSHPLIARLIQVVITGLLQPFLAYKIGKHLFSENVGLVSAGLTALYAYFIYYDATLMTEPFFITLLLGGLYLTILIAQLSTNAKGQFPVGKGLLLSLLLGLTLGGAILLRQLIFLVIPFLFLWIWWVRRKQSFRLTLVYIITPFVIILMMILPFTIYNTSRFGHFVLLNTNSGYAFFWANHPIYGTHFQDILTTGSYQDLIPIELRNLDEAALDQALLRRGIQFVVDNPVRYLLLSISRIPVYFKFWPSKDTGLISNISRVASFGLLWPFMLYGLYRSIASQKQSLKDRLASPTCLLVLFVSIYSLIHLLSWSLTRYRLPVDAILLIFAGLAVVDLAQRIISWRQVPVRTV
jgi:4-amino-4-deoxy-L-arabinose transferase-like glycosyltransferase